MYLNFTDREVVLQRQIGSLKNQLDSFRGISFYKRWVYAKYTSIIKKYVIKLKKAGLRSTKTDCLS